MPDTSLYNDIRFRNGSQMIVDNKTMGFSEASKLLINEQLNKIYSSAISYGGSDYPVPLETSCSHSWKSYTGLNTMFEYCEVCDAKKNERKG
jgi:hypothetical protein